MLFLQASYAKPITNYVKIMVPELLYTQFGTSLTSAFDIDGNGEDRLRKGKDGEG